MGPLSRASSQQSLIHVRPCMTHHRSRTSVKRAIQKEVFVDAPRNCFEALFRCCYHSSTSQAIDPVRVKKESASTVSFHDITVDRGVFIKD